VLGAWYLFTMTRRLLFGPLKEPRHEGHHVADLSVREWALLAPLVIVCVALGVYPRPVLRSTEPDVRLIAGFAEQARERAAGTARAQARP
jgi:NADH-quinone oxidoreductase subunit M